MKRFQDKNYTLGHFENEIFIQCPKCQLRAIISRDEPSYFSTRRINCPNCSYTQIGRKESYRVELNCKCSNCAADIKFNIPSVNEKKEEVSIKCSNCGETNNYKPRNIRQEWLYEYNGIPTDPYFQLPLWLTESVKGNILWAYNYEHLSYLKEYISADLREKYGRSGWTMVEKLPAWMTSGKNREAVLKGINKLDNK